MLASFVRLAVFIGLVVGATWAVTELTVMEGTVTVALAGYEHVLSPLAFAVMLFLLAGALVLVVRLVDAAVTLLLFVLRDPKAVSRLTSARRRRRALDAVAGALVSVAARDGKEAAARLKEVQRLSDGPAIPRLLGAMAAAAVGDRAKAGAHYRALAEDPDTALAGIRGQLDLALDTGDTAHARELAERAVKRRPNDRMLLETLCELQQAEGDWAGARTTLARLRAQKALPGPEADRREAAVALALATEADRVGNRAAARDLAGQAARLDPLNSGAVAAAARHLAHDGAPEEASALIAAAWALEPDPTLANAFAELVPDESPEARWQRFQTLFATNPRHRETCYLKAELALVARRWAEARRAIEARRDGELTARGCAIMAAIARGEGEREAVVRAWLARALTAPPETGPDRDISQTAMLPLLVEDDLPGPAPDDGLSPGTGVERFRPAKGD